VITLDDKYFEIMTSPARDVGIVTKTLFSLDIQGTPGLGHATKTSDH